MYDVDEYLINDHKVYVDVYEVRSKDGKLIPLSFIWKDGIKYKIDKVIHDEPGHSLKAGGYGRRYTVQIQGQVKYMFFEVDRWFMESK